MVVEHLSVDVYEKHLLVLETISMYRNWRDLIRPKNLLVDRESLTPQYGKFYAEPLDRGFGITLGNALRRVLLSSLQGAAVCAVRIEGVMHEFTAIGDITEDVSDIILALKEVLLSTQAVEPRVLRVDVKGSEKEETVVCAHHLMGDDSIKILNPDHPICTIAPGGRLAMEVMVRRGRGYVPAEKNKTPNMAIGWIPIDSLFSPVRKVNFNVTHARVGQVTDYDKLSLEVWTDGSVSPEDAVALAAKILKEQLTVFINFEEEQEFDLNEESPSEDKLGAILMRSVDELDLSVRAENCLQSAGVKYIGDLVQKTEQEMLRTKNFGRKSLKEIKELLADMGLKLGMPVDNWPPRELRQQSK
jgi:DNA-directed RNA polymerase subunit alpha